MLEDPLLSELSRELLVRLLANYPDWHRFVEVLDSGDESKRIIRVKVPTMDDGRFLWVDTEDGDVTIGFDEWHTHVSLWLEETDSEADANIVERGVQLISQIVNEQVVVVVCYQDGHWAGSELIEAGETVRPPDGGEARIRSWCGTHDRVIQDGGT